MDNVLMHVLIKLLSFNLYIVFLTPKINPDSTRYCLFEIYIKLAIFSIHG